MRNEPIWPRVNDPGSGERECVGVRNELQSGLLVAPGCISAVRMCGTNPPPSREVSFGCAASQNVAFGCAEEAVGPTGDPWALPRTNRSTLPSTRSRSLGRMERMRDARNEPNASDAVVPGGGDSVDGADVRDGLQTGLSVAGGTGENDSACKTNPPRAARELRHVRRSIGVDRTATRSRGTNPPRRAFVGRGGTASAPLRGRRLRLSRSGADAVPPSVGGRQRDKCAERTHRERIDVGDDSQCCGRRCAGGGIRASVNRR